MQHNCYTCKYRGEVPGSAHSSCNSTGDSSIAMYVAMFIEKSGCNFENLRLNPHGVKNGWAFWPVDFDPVWVEHCNFYEKV